MKKIFLLITLISAAFLAKSQTVISAKDIAKSLGKTVVVCDSVYGARAFDKLTLLNMGGSFPNESFTVVINKADESKFSSAPNVMFAEKKICVTGVVSEYKGKMQIVVTEPKQITLNK